MSDVEGWIAERYKLSQDDKRGLDDLKARARFALYCQIGTDGTCMADSGASVAERADRFSVEAKDFFKNCLLKLKRR